MVGPGSNHACGTNSGIMDRAKNDPGGCFTEASDARTLLLNALRREIGTSTGLLPQHPHQLGALPVRLNCVATSPPGGRQSGKGCSPIIDLPHRSQLKSRFAVRLIVEKRHDMSLSKKTAFSTAIFDPLTIA